MIKQTQLKEKSVRESAHEKNTQNIESVQYDFTPAQLETERHLKLLFNHFIGSGMFFEIRTLSDKTKQEFFEINTENFKKAAMKYASKENVCVSVHPRVREEGSSDTVEKAIYLFVDLDRIDKNRSTSTHENVLSELFILDLKPSFIVCSGFGFHVYFKLEREISKEEFEKYERALIEYLQKYAKFQNLEVDSQCKDPARILRLAGTINAKQNEARTTKILYESDEVLTQQKIENIINITEEAQEEQAYEVTSTENFLTTLAEIAKEAFKEGQRQFVTLFVAGILAKSGCDEKTAKDFYKENLENIDDEKDKRMRIRAIERTYELFSKGRKVKGISGLKKYVDCSKLEALLNIRNHEQIDTLFISASELKQRQPKMKTFIVENVLPTGLVVFAGKSKLGKSWFALYLALHISTNKPLFGKFNIQKQGDVYYFALEDSEYRLKLRQDKLLEALGETFSLERVHFFIPKAQTIFRLDEKGYKLLDRIAKKPNTAAIIIDTFVRAKVHKRNNANDYDYDTQILSQLQRIAIENDIAIILIHHVRKMPSEDVFDTIIGSTAIASTADTTIVFERLRKADLVKIHVTGRDVEEQSIALRFDIKENVFFKFEGDAEEYELGQVAREILEATESEILSFTELCERLDRGAGTIYKAIRRLTEENKLTVFKKGRATYYQKKMN